MTREELQAELDKAIEQYNKETASFAIMPLPIIDTIIDFIFFVCVNDDTDILNYIRRYRLKIERIDALCEEHDEKINRRCESPTKKLWDYLLSTLLRNIIQANL